MAMLDTLVSGLDALKVQAVMLSGQVDALQGENSDLQVRLDAALARIKELEASLVPATVFSWDVSSLGSDANVSEATKINGHKAMFDVDNIQHVRVFLQAPSATAWNNPRFVPLTDKDSVLVSFKDRSRAGLKAFLAATPEKFRKRKGQVELCFHHEFEAEWASAADRPGWLKNYLDANLELAEELDASPFDTQSRDNVVKIFLWYSQVIDGRTKGQWKQFIGDQKFGMIGMDCYNYQVWLSRGRYATPQELFDPLISMGKETGLPICAPEWGGELADGDTGAGLAKAIKEQGAYAKANGLKFANWWCATGSKDTATGLPRNHHVDKIPAALAEMKALIQG